MSVIPNSRDEKRHQILKAAEKQMSLKGPNDTSISEIAQSAGVKDSIIYQFFKNKEDLLFSIPLSRMEEVIAYLNEHLQGIRDPESCLRKMVWFHLYYNDNHRDYIRLVLLECRANKNFYRHEAYSLIRKYSGFLSSILEAGVLANIFRRDVNMRLVRDIIFGVLDWECLSCLAAGEIGETVSDLDDIMGLILPMIAVEKAVIPTRPDKSAKILKAAEKVFANKGYNQGSITEIAKQADVSEGTIYEYFQNKEDLLLSISEHRFEKQIHGLGELFNTEAPQNKLQQFMQNHFYDYLSEPDFLRVFLFDIQLNRRFYNSRAYQAFKKYINTLDLILDEGKQGGSIRPGVNNRIFKNLFLGAFSHMALRWLTLPSDPRTDRLDEIREVVSLLLHAAANGSVTV